MIDIMLMEFLNTAVCLNVQVYLLYLSSSPFFLCRMASNSVKIWVKVEDGRPRATKVSVPLDADINHVVKKALVEEQVGIAAGLVSVKFNEEEVRADAGAVDYEDKTSDMNPLLLIIEQKGEQPLLVQYVQYTVCDDG